MREGDRRSPGDLIVGNREGLGRSMCVGLFVVVFGSGGGSCSGEVGMVVLGSRSAGGGPSRGRVFKASIDSLRAGTGSGMSSAFLATS